MEQRNAKNSTENKSSNAKNTTSNKASNSTTSGKHPNQYTKGADDKSAKNSNSKSCS